MITEWFNLKKEAACAERVLGYELPLPLLYEWGIGLYALTAEMQDPEMFLRSLAVEVERMAEADLDTEKPELAVPTRKSIPRSWKIDVLRATFTFTFADERGNPPSAYIIPLRAKQEAVVVVPEKEEPKKKKD